MLSALGLEHGPSVELKGFVLDRGFRLAIFAEFWAARARPSGVLGPVDSCALARLASICFSVDIVLSFANSLGGEGALDVSAASPPADEVSRRDRENEAWFLEVVENEGDLAEKIRE